MVIGIFAFLLAFAVGVLIGGATGLFDTIGVGAFIVLITLLVATVLALVIYYLCRECRRRCWGEKNNVWYDVIKIMLKDYNIINKILHYI